MAIDESNNGFERYNHQKIETKWQKNWQVTSKKEVVISPTPEG